MTHHPIRILEDGTRIYASYNRYTPVPVEERRIGIRKPADPGAVRFHGNWLLPLPLLPDEQRVMPLTRPDDQTLEHKARCRCEVCRRPVASDVWRRAREREARRESS